MKRARVELESDDGEDEDGEHDQQPDLHQGREGLEDRLQHDLKTLKRRKMWDRLNRVEKNFGNNGRKIKVL